MKARLEYAKVAPGAVHAMLGLEKYVNTCGLERGLIHLVKLRASQINGCAFCTNMHVNEAITDGEKPARLYMLTVWREAPLYTARERAALLWTETLTRIADGGAPDSIYEEVRQHFTEAEIVNLSLAIVAINGWNRLAIGFAVPPDLKIEQVGQS
jgi:AhpD family alkylhydroperoxidase